MFERTVKPDRGSADIQGMDTELNMRFIPESLRARRSSARRLAAAGAIVADMLDANHPGGMKPSSQEIADAIVNWLKTGERGQ